MLLTLSFRLAPRFSRLAQSSTRPVLSRPTPSFNGLTRSFWGSSVPRAAHVDEPIADTTASADVDAKPTRRKRVSKESKAKNPTSKKPKPEKPKKVVITKDMKPPKAPATAYFQFLIQDFLGRHPKPTSLEEGATMAKEAGREWRALSDAQRASWHAIAEKDREQYVKDRGEWFKNVDPEVLKVLKSRIKRGERKLRKPKAQGSLKRPMTAFIRFVQDFRKLHSGDAKYLHKPTVLLTDAGPQWKSMTEEEKRPYEEQYKAAREEYDAKKAALKASSD